MMKKIVYLFLMLLIVMSCEQQDNLKKGKPDAVPDDVIAKLKAAGFDTSEGLQKFRDGYIVEYDIYLTIPQINSLDAQQKGIKNGRTQHYVTNNLVLSTPRMISVFMDTNFGTYMQTAFDQALARYNAESISLRFQRVLNAANADISVTAFYQESTLLGVSAGFPANGNPASPVQLNTYYYNDAAQRADAATTIAHEIGHAIGFRHTDYMDRSFSCGGASINEGAGTEGANHVAGTPTGASNGSWMLACSSNTNRPFTSEDRVALTTTYGVSDLFIAKSGTLYAVDKASGSSSGFNNAFQPTDAMTGYGGNIYAAHSGTLYQVNPNSGLATPFSAYPNGWPNTEAMTAMSGYIYAVQEGSMYQVTISTGNVVAFSDYPDGWANTEAMAASGGYIYAVQQGTMYRVTVSNGDVITFSDYPDGWANTEAMAVVGGYIYAVQNGTLYRVTISNGDVVPFSDYPDGWSGTLAMTVLDGYLYAVQAGALWRVNVSNGGISQIGTGDWSGTQAMAAKQ